MAITIDQFLRELTERRLLSGEEASAFRQKFAPTTHESHATRREGATKNGSASHTVTKTVTTPDSSPLILCNCLLKERVQDEDDHLIFQAEHLQNNAKVSIHILMPRVSTPQNPCQSDSDTNPREHVSNDTNVGILDLGRHGEMVCVCCQAIEAESLFEVVQQYETLPLELATESLLETVKTLERLQNQGLHLEAVAPEQLLLDEDGHIHLSGRNPSAIVGSSFFASDEGRPPTPQLLESLGALYIFLQSGRWEPHPYPAMAEDTDSRSAALIYQRLTEANGTPGYKSWSELGRDLTALLEGREILPPTSQSAEAPPSAIPEPVTTTSLEAEKFAKSSSKQGLLIGLALLGGIIIAGVVMLLR